MIRQFLRDLQSGPLTTQLRRFVVVGIVAAAAQMVLLWAFVDRVGFHYLAGAVIAIEITIILSYVLNNSWTFQETQNTGLIEYFVGLIKTNIVRGTAMPIQIGILSILVELLSIPYLPANGVAIIISGVYRYLLEARWTWG
jgi:Predicted membrane protein